MLRLWLPHKPVKTPVFNTPDKLPPMVRADLRRARASWIKAAGDPAQRRERCRSDFLAYIDDDGRVVDFHALRATYITMLVKSGASVKEAQELARHSDPKLTMNVYTKLGIHDLAGALDRLPGLSPSQPDRSVLRATGTGDAAMIDHQQYARQCARESVRPSATVSDDDGTGTRRFDSRKSFTGADMSDAARSGAASCDKATRETRTRDLSFTKAPLYQLS